MEKDYFVPRWCSCDFIPAGAHWTMAKPWPLGHSAHLFALPVGQTYMCGTCALNAHTFTTYTSLQWCMNLSPPLALRGILAKSLEAEQLSKRVLTYTALSEAATWGAYSTPRVSFKSRTNSGIGLILHYPSFLSHLSFPQVLSPASFVSFSENRHMLVQKMGCIKPIYHLLIHLLHAQTPN